LEIIQYIKNIFNSNKIERQLDNSFVFPYSTDKEIKRQQIWDNLQKGLLFEDTQVFIPWSTSYWKINKYAEQRKNSGDRTNWFLGEHKIFDGLNSFVGVMKWSWVNKLKPFSEITENLGYDDEGNRRFLALQEHFTNLLGEPTSIELEKFGGNDLGSIVWTKGKVQIYIGGIEQFACKYRMYIGLKENENE